MLALGKVPGHQVNRENQRMGFLPDFKLLKRWRRRHCRSSSSGSSSSGSWLLASGSWLLASGFWLLSLQTLSAFDVDAREVVVEVQEDGERHRGFGGGEDDHEHCEDLAVERR